MSVALHHEHAFHAASRAHLGSTFYFIRCQQNPSFYGLPTGLAEGGLYAHMQTTCLNGLKQASMNCACTCEYGAATDSGSFT